jgi:serine/threonine protein phosphatase 1
MNALHHAPMIEGMGTGGRLAYAIGDIHGRDDLFALLIDQIIADAAEHRAHFVQPPLLVMLGDYIDRGRQSPQVLDRLLALRRAAEFETRFLCGNHEEAMLDFIDGRNSGRGWARFGGRNTMESYGVRPPLSENDHDGWAAAREAFIVAVPETHVALLRGMELYLVCGELLFVHAGVRLGVALEAQKREDLLGIRNDFLEAEEEFDYFVVHGHTPVEQCDLRPRRLNLDTGAYMTGLLSAARFTGGAPTILSAPRRIQVGANTAAPTATRSFSQNR